MFFITVTVYLRINRNFFFFWILYLLCLCHNCPHRGIQAVYGGKLGKLVQGTQTSCTTYQGHRLEPVQEMFTSVYFYGDAVCDRSY